MSISKNSQNNFSSLNIQDLIDTFNLQETTLDFPEIGIKKEQLEQILQISKNAKNQIEYWNEQELIMKHLVFILNTVNLEGENYTTFAERELTGEVEGFTLTGKVDFLVARGKYSPTKPYFFIQEYKRFQMGPKSDPLAQVLAEMLIASVLNNENKMYGAYIVGQYWRFVVLENKK